MLYTNQTGENSHELIKWRDTDVVKEMHRDAQRCAGNMKNIVVKVVVFIELDIHYKFNEKFWKVRGDWL